MKATYQIYDIEDVFRYFAKGFALKEDQRVAATETQYDPRTGKVVFFFYEDEKPNHETCQ